MIAADYVFISYAHRDEAFVVTLKQRLDRLGIKTWRDRENILAGQDWAEAIRQGIENCASVILVLSPPALDSAWVGNERRYALDYEKPIFPVLLHNCKIPRQYSHIQYTDFQRDDDFDYALLTLARGLAQVLPNGVALLAKLPDTPAELAISESLKQIRRSEQGIRDWLQEVRRDREQQETVGEATAIRLADLASDSHLRNVQLVEDSARAIADLDPLGFSHAVEHLVAKYQTAQDAGRALDALALIREEKGFLPPDLLHGIGWRVDLRLALRQITAQPLLPRFVFAATGAILGIFAALFIEFADPQGRFPLTRWSNALSNGALYGLLVAVATVSASQIVPRLRLLNRWRFPLSLLSGWALTGLVFGLMNRLFYTRTPTSWESVVWLSLLFIAGFALAALIPPRTLRQTLLRTIVAFAGVFGALYLPCAVVYSDLSLLYYYSDCLPKSLLIGFLISAITFLPEIVDHLMARESAAVGQRLSQMVRKVKPYRRK